MIFSDYHIQVGLPVACLTAPYSQAYAREETDNPKRTPKRREMDCTDYSSFVIVGLAKQI